MQLECRLIMLAMMTPLAGLDRSKLDRIDDPFLVLMQPLGFLVGVTQDQVLVTPG